MKLPPQMNPTVPWSAPIADLDAASHRRRCPRSCSRTRCPRRGARASPSGRGSRTSVRSIPRTNGSTRRAHAARELSWPRGAGGSGRGCVTRRAAAPWSCPTFARAPTRGSIPGSRDAPRRSAANSPNNVASITGGVHRIAAREERRLARRAHLHLPVDPQVRKRQVEADDGATRSATVAPSCGCIKMYRCRWTPIPRTGRLRSQKLRTRRRGHRGARRRSAHACHPGARDRPRAPGRGRGGGRAEHSCQSASAATIAPSGGGGTPRTNAATPPRHRSGSRMGSSGRRRARHPMTTTASSDVVPR